jgi:CubicO group peptidase (beta-lactamase class C family)
MLSDIETLVASAGLARVPLALSVRARDRSLDWGQGVWPDGRPVAVADRFYGASLAKQVTGAAIALLARRGDLDIDRPIGDVLLDLPAWRREVTSRHLLHHLGGLPEMDELGGPGHRTSARVLTALAGSPNLVSVPGAAFRYSNAGYICLATIVERVSGMSFDLFARRDLFDPLALTDIDVDATPSCPQLAGMGDVLPLSFGDGGLWTSAPAFADWLDHQNRDALGIASLVQQPGRLNDGTPTDYGWGIGLRKLAGHDLFIHGGGWPGAYSKAVRSPSLGLSIVALAATDTQAGVIALVDDLARQLAG